MQFWVTEDYLLSKFHEVFVQIVDNLPIVDTSVVYLHRVEHLNRKTQRLDINVQLVRCISCYRHDVFCLCIVDQAESLPGVGILSVS